MKEKNLFDTENQTIEKVFTSKDVFYNNGIVNLYQFLKERDFDVKVDQQNLILILDSIQSDEIYFDILNRFIKENEIVYQTKNDRWYFDEKKKTFILDKKFDTKGGQKNDLRNGVYQYKKILDIGMNREEVETLYLEFCEFYNQKPEKENNGKLKVPNKNNEVIVAITLDDAITRFTEYFVSEDSLSIDSKIHSFEDGQGIFHDLLKPSRTYKIDKWDALIYWFGSRTKRFFNYSYFIYPNSSNLEALAKFKSFLKISDDKATIRDKKTDELKEIGSNIDFYAVLKKDEINNENFYISKSTEEFELKFFMYIFSTMSHIEDQYEKTNERRRAKLQELFETLQYISFVIYTDDGTFKTSLNEYTKAYKLMLFFDGLKENHLYKFLADLILNISIAKKKKKVEPKEVYNQYTQIFCSRLLNFQSLRDVFYLVSFEILKTMEDNKKEGYYNRLSESLFEFEQLYLNHILGGKEMSVHENAKKVGDGIGHFCAELEDKDLLFKLRNVKNYKQMLSYFKDLKFSTLKNQSDARFSKDFNESLEVILGDLEENWEIYRDYIAIYAIDKFKAVSYAKTK